MRNTLFLLLALLINLSPAIAQPQVSLSEPFDEPEGGYNKVLQLKNGNTFYFQFTKEDFKLFAYDKAHKAISVKEIKGNDWEPRRINGTTINGIYEINGEPTLFVTQIISKVPTLFRLRFNPTTAEITEEKAILTLPKYATGSAWAMAYGDVDPSAFYLEKDANSDVYSVVCFNGFAKESGERLKLVQFNGQHQEVNSAFFGSPGNFKFTNYIAMCVNGDETYLCTYGYNTGGAPDARVIISKLKTSEKEFAFSFADFNTNGKEHVVISRSNAGASMAQRTHYSIGRDFRETKGMMVYNPGTKTVQLMTVTFQSAEKKFFSNKASIDHLKLISYIDPVSLKITSSVELDGAKIAEYSKTKLAQTNSAVGMPQNMIINKDNSTTILFEEMFYRIKTRTQNFREVKVSEETFLENAGILHLDTKGTEVSGIAIKKNQLSDGIVSSMEQGEKVKSQWKYEPINMMQARTNHFFSYDYITTSKGKFVLFNDYAENFQSDDKVEKKQVKGASESNMVCYHIDNNGGYKKYYLFGQPGDDKQRVFSHIQSSNYSSENNSYATLVVERIGRKKQSRIAWLSL
jgi:hypothetical protein